MREVGSFRASDVSSLPSSCLKRMTQIDENENESLEANCDQSRNLVNDNGNSKCYMPSFTSELRDGSAYNVQKAASENDEIMFSTSNALELQVYHF